VRVVRKANGGYIYDGLYRVERYWPAKGKSGFVIYRYRLVRDDLAIPDDLPDPPIGPGQHKSYTVTRVVRDTQIGKEVKALHKYTCQVCGESLVSPAGPYAEAAHIRPLGKPHDGPDSKDNVLCVCPNHRVLFDLFGLSIAADLSLIGVKGRLRTHPRHHLSAATSNIIAASTRWRTGVKRRPEPRDESGGLLDRRAPERRRRSDIARVRRNHVGMGVFDCLPSGESVLNADVGGLRTTSLFDQRSDRGHKLPDGQLIRCGQFV